MWDLKNYSSVQTTSSGDRYMSSKALQAYNCREETRAIISVILYSGSMGEGNAVLSHSVKERDWNWHPVAPGTTVETLWKIA